MKECSGRTDGRRRVNERIASSIHTPPTLPPSLQPGSLLPCRVRCHSPLEQDVKIDDGVSSPFRLRAARAQAAAAAAGPADLRTDGPTFSQNPKSCHHLSS